EQGDSGGTVTRIDVPEPDPADEEALHNSYHVTLFRGINEGLADFWAWMYTGDGNFIASSLPGEGARRSLDAGELKSLSTTAMIKENVKGILPSDNSAGQMTAYAYLIGTQFSRLMKSFTERVISARDLQTLEGRQQVAGWLVKALPSMRSDFLAVLDSGYYNPTQFIQSLISVVPELKEEECQYLRDVNNSSSENRVRCQQDGSNWKILAE
ncbi:MAG TPA: hypothetical protein VN132_08350, partial [Bdellovibrio sp.]|nr:hypothetical protein [Bdellovibrio sp.]